MVRRPVETLTDDDVRGVMRRIGDHILADGLVPAYVVTILRGGRYPSRCLLDHLKGAGVAPEELQLQIQRPSTGWLKSVIVRGVRRTPRALRDSLRVTEGWTRHLLLRLGVRSLEPDLSDQAEIVATLRHELELGRVSVASPVIVVDDAIDTGWSMAVAIRAMEEVGIARAAIRIVAITHTLPDPLSVADYFAYDRQLCRFSWSDDASETAKGAHDPSEETT